MKITVNREVPTPPPVKSITLELTVSQARYIMYLAALGDADGLVDLAARSLYRAMSSIPEIAQASLDSYVRFE